MDREQPRASSTPDIPGFERPKLRSLGRLTTLTQSFSPGSNTDFTHTSF
jgi:hypothetical protein